MKEINSLIQDVIFGGKGKITAGTNCPRGSKTRGGGGAGGAAGVGGGVRVNRVGGGAGGISSRIKLNIL